MGISWLLLLVLPAGSGIWLQTGSAGGGSGSALSSPWVETQGYNISRADGTIFSLG